MGFERVEKALSELELSVSPSLRAWGQELMKRPNRKLRADGRVIRDVQEEIYRHRQKVKNIRHTNSLFPNNRALWRRLRKESKEADTLEQEFNWICTTRAEDKRRYEFALLMTRISVANTQISFSGLAWWEKREMRNKLKTLRKALDKAYSNGNSLPRADYENIFERETLPLAHTINGIREIGVGDMPEEIEKYFY